MNRLAAAERATGAELAFRSVDELLAGFRSREFSPSEVLEEVLARAERFAGLKPFLTVDPDGARAAARVADDGYARGAQEPARPLLGVPVTIKDLLRTEGLRTTRGSLLTADQVPDEDAPAVARLRAAGAVVVGKTNTSEGGWKGDAGNRLIGPSANPWDPRFTSGGSSGGAGVAAALGLGPIAVGTDGGGSVRIPAAYCGVVGYKPTFGRIPYHPPSPEGLSHVGPLTRTVADAATAARHMAGYDPRDPTSVPGRGAAVPAPRRPLRIRMATSLGFASAGPEACAATRSAAAVLARAGHDVVELDLDLPDQLGTMMTLWAGHESVSYGADLDRVADRLDPGLLALIRYGRTLSAYDLAAAHAGRAELRQRMRSEMGAFDVLLTPTMPGTAFALGLDAPPEEAGADVVGLGWTPFTYLFNLTGQPAVSVPAGLSRAGLPLGVQLVGLLHRDGDVLATASDFEANRPWRPDYPGLDPHIDHPTEGDEGR
ncbi:amidase family protein [Nocardioides sp. L-11A]|uniref:amidase family protein n=1 Tax=Nocardioides sp. L-11A TaxID=3043848 RepID=UPI00249BAAF5|nr:amidase family protein [Nocardioides sp. L-11A]